jgi:hypothetical protein
MLAISQHISSTYCIQRTICWSFSHHDDHTYPSCCSTPGWGVEGMVSSTVARKGTQVAKGESGEQLSGASGLWGLECMFVLTSLGS